MSRLRLNALPGRPEAGAGRAPPDRLDRAELARLGALRCLHLGIAPLAGTPPRCAVVDPAALDRVPWPGGRPEPVPVPLPVLLAHCPCQRLLRSCAPLCPRPQS